MSEKISQANWTEHLLRPAHNWDRDLSKVPVIKITTVFPDGRKVREEFAAVGPVTTSAQDRKTPVVSFQYEVDPEGVSSSRSEIEVEILKKGEWVNSHGVKRLIEFVGFAGDEGLKDKKWSYFRS